MFGCKLNMENEMDDKETRVVVFSIKNEVHEIANGGRWQYVSLSMKG